MPARELMPLEYFNQPAAATVAATATAGGWYRTGDAVVRHADGTFTFVDRMPDTIRRNGENISSTAIETVICNDPAVGECAVLGVPDPVAGPAVAVEVVPSSAGCDPALLYERLRSELPRHALPSYVILTGTLPRTPASKVRKTELERLARPLRSPGLISEVAPSPSSAGAAA
jgi:carnitine-CoA ligase